MSKIMIKNVVIKVNETTSQTKRECSLTRNNQDPKTMIMINIINGIILIIEKGG